MKSKQLSRKQFPTRNHFAPELEVSRITRFIKRCVKQSGAKGIVVGVSGGIDSAVVASLSKRALGPGRVLGLFMFEDSQRRSKDAMDAKKIAGSLGIKTSDLSITPLVKAYVKSLLTRRIKTSKLTLANIKARVRMTLLYSFANQENLLVAGTGDKSEILVGYFTKYGDGAADLLPIAHLYKMEVRSLGSELRLPYNIVVKPSSPNLWKGHLASQELPADYDLLDRALTLLFDSKKSPKEVSEATGASIAVIGRIMTLNKKSQHKRNPPLSM